MSLLTFKNLSFVLPHKTCFEDFSVHVHQGARIGIIGTNGQGKSSLLQIIAGKRNPSAGEVIKSTGLTVALVPQVVNNHPELSGGQRLNKALSEALSMQPDVLLLDEPTNHLGQKNRHSLMKMLDRFRGILLIVSHDTELLRACVDQLWILEDGTIRFFKGAYDDYIRERDHETKALERSLDALSRDKKSLHQALMQEQQRAKNSKNKGKKGIATNKWPKVAANAKASCAESTRGGKQQAMRQKREDTLEKLSTTRLPEIRTPHFSLTTHVKDARPVVSVVEGSFGYQGDVPLITDLHFHMAPTDRMALMGPNGCGKTTFLRAILGDTSVHRSGDWHVLPSEHIGYLDQHYDTLDPHKTVFETIEMLCPNWSPQEVRSHLNDFLFRKNEEVNTLTQHLSGGEKARLSLAQIAASTPRLLILDEVTNNLDLTTKNYVTQILKNYPGALLVVSHEQDFTDAIGAESFLLQTRTRK